MLSVGIQYTYFNQSKIIAKTLKGFLIFDRQEVRWTFMTALFSVFLSLPE